MTVQEAKESIEYLKMQLIEDLEMICFTGDELKALDMSIQALEEVEQYRALGTVEELTNQKHNLSVAYKCIEELQQKDWIPCEVELPKENTEVWVTVEELDGGCYTQASWLQDGQWVIKKTPLEPKVIAWMYKLQPYKKECAENG